MDKRALAGHLAAAGAYTIFGLNIVFTKDISNAGAVSPLTLFTLRTLGATTLFWIVSLFSPKEKMSPKDILLTMGASILGLITPLLTFLFAITVSTSIDTAIVSTLSPVFTMFFAAIFIKEPITWKKAGGVALSLGGAILLIFSSVRASNGVVATSPLGFVLLFFNCISFAAYLGIFRPLIARYSVITFMKWMFLFAFLLPVPFSASEVLATDLTAITPRIGMEVIYIIVFATFVAYFLIPFGQKRIRPTLVSLYCYIQPIIACIVSMTMGLDTLNWQKAVAIVLVFTGVYVVNNSRAKA